MNNEQYGEDTLIYMARCYYAAHTNHEPEFVEVESNKNDIVELHLYDMLDDHTATCDRYYINAKTGKGKNVAGDEIDLLAELPKLWAPGAEAYGYIPFDYYGAVLYLGSTDRSDWKQSVNAELKRFVSTTKYYKEYSFLKDIPIDTNYFATENGTEVWLILPKNDMGWITVYELDPSTGKNKYRLTRTGNSAPIILCCNYSDISSDVSVQITYPTRERAPFSPYISMMDGNPTTTDEDNILVLN